MTTMNTNQALIETAWRLAEECELDMGDLGRQMGSDYLLALLDAMEREAALTVREADHNRYGVVEIDGEDVYYHHDGADTYWVSGDDNPDRFARQVRELQAYEMSDLHYVDDAKMLQAISNRYDPYADWMGYYPTIDTDGSMTGDVVEMDDDRYIPVDDMVYISRDDVAEDPRWTIKDGFAEPV